MRTARGERVARVPIAAISLSVLLLSASSCSDSSASGKSSISDAEVTVPVEFRTLITEFPIQATVVPTKSTALSAPSDVTGALVVTATPLQADAPVQSGTAVLELNGRPVIAWRTGIAPYRDLRPSDRGPDVAAIQVTLASIGKPVSESEAGRFGEETQRAIADVYGAAGYAPVYTAGSEQAVEAANTAAEAKVDAARAALSKANSAQYPDNASADAAQTAAQADLQAAEAARDQTYASEGVVLPAKEVFRIEADSMVLLGYDAVLGQPVAANQQLAVVGTSSTEVRAPLTGAQSSEVQSSGKPFTIRITGSDAKTACTAAAPVPEAQSPMPAVLGGPATKAGSAKTQPNTNADDGGSSAADRWIITASCTSLPSNAKIGSSIPVSLEVKYTDESRPVVPASAIVSAVNGDAAVFVAGQSGKFERVKVVIVGEADGYVAVDVPSGELTKKSRVRVRER